MGGAKCPRCRGPIVKEGFIGNNYYCQCGWSFQNVQRNEDNSSSIVAILCLLLIGSFLMYAAVNPNIKNHIAVKVASLNLK
jgi:uncharacterized protein (DUF983 family)